MENTKKLTGKDLINVGIYTAMTLVIFFVVGLLTALPVVYPFLFIIWPIVCGIPMMLYYTKIQKFGMLTITGIIGGIFFYLIGYGWNYPERSKRSHEDGREGSLRMRYSRSPLRPCDQQDRGISYKGNGTPQHYPASCREEDP